MLFESCEARWPARFVNFSQDGFGIQTHAALTAGHKLEVVFPEGQFPPVYCRVIWVRLGQGDLPVEAGLEILSDSVQV
jgi:hypothetical protein